MANKQHLCITYMKYTAQDESRVANIAECYICHQRWGSYFLKVTHYLLLLPVTKSNSLQLHIT